MSLQTRINAEKRITKTLIKSILDLGYTIDIDDGEERLTNLTASQALEHALSVDECNLYARKPSEKTAGKFVTVASFFLVYGNDGFDCICDHSVTDETDQILLAVNPLIKQLEERLA